MANFSPGSVISLVNVLDKLYFVCSILANFDGSFKPFPDGIMSSLTSVNRARNCTLVPLVPPRILWTFSVCRAFIWERFYNVTSGHQLCQFTDSKQDKLSELWHFFSIYTVSHVGPFLLTSGQHRMCHLWPGLYLRVTGTHSWTLPLAREVTGLGHDRTRNNSFKRNNTTYCISHTGVIDF